MTKEDRKNAYLYCKFRDEQFALYDEYAKRHGMLMKTLLVANVLFYGRNDADGNLPENLSIQTNGESDHQKFSVCQLCDCHRGTGK